MDKWTINLCLYAAASLWWPMAFAQDNMFFSGTLMDEPCTLDVQDEAIELDFKSVLDRDLYLNNRTPGSPITLRLKNCSLEVGMRMVNITFTGDESIEMPGLLVLQTTDAKGGLLVGLEAMDGTPLPLSKTHSMGELSSGNNQIKFNAYLQGEPKALADHTLGLGSFTGALSFKLSYD